MVVLASKSTNCQATEQQQSCQAATAFAPQLHYQSTGITAAFADDLLRLVD
jgi:hypothetical protein